MPIRPYQEGNVPINTGEPEEKTKPIDPATTQNPNYPLRNTFQTLQLEGALHIPAKIPESHELTQHTKVLFPSSSLCLYPALMAEVVKRAFAERGEHYDPNLSQLENVTRLGRTFIQIQREISEDLERASIEEVIPIDDVMNEYRAIQRAIVKAMGVDAIQIIDLPFSERFSPKVRQMFEEFVEETNATFPTLERAFKRKLQGFPRDWYVQVGDYVFLRSAPEIVPQELGDMKLSISHLGEGGAVLSVGNSLLISDKIWNRAIGSVQVLQEAGYKLAPIPELLPNGQTGEKRGFALGHIDGHAGLVQDPLTGEITFLYAKSYAEQDSQTKGLIINAAKVINATPVEIDDTELPLNALNFIQLPNGKVICPRGGKIDSSGHYDQSKLENVLEKIVGSKNLIITDIPITYFPIYLHASVRCMTNTAGPGLLALITK